MIKKGLLLTVLLCLVLMFFYNDKLFSFAIKLYSDNVNGRVVMELEGEDVLVPSGWVVLRSQGNRAVLNHVDSGIMVLFDHFEIDEPNYINNKIASTVAKNYAGGKQEWNELLKKGEGQRFILIENYSVQGTPITKFKHANGMELKAAGDYTLDYSVGNRVFLGASSIKSKADQSGLPAVVAEALVDKLAESLAKAISASHAK